MKEIEQRIAKMETDMAAAFNRHDVDAIVESFDEQLVAFSSTKHERLHGLDSFRKTFMYYLKQSERTEFELEEIQVQTFGSTAISTFYWSVTVETKTGPHEINGRGSHVFVERNGEWKIVHEHFSRAHNQPELWDTSPGL